MVAIHVVDIHYWYTRTSAYAVDLTEHLFLEFTSLQGLRGAGLIRTAVAYLVVGSLYVLLVLPTVFMAKTVYRLELAWLSLGRTWRWVKVKVPVLRRMRESHKERSSARLDRRSNWQMMASLYVALWTYFWVYPSSHYIMQLSMSPDPTGDEIWFPNRFVPALSPAWDIVGQLFQFLLNRRTGLFGGRLLKFVKAFTGPYEVVPRFMMQEVLVIVMPAAMAWQALTMKEVDARAGDADDDEE